MTTWEHKGDWGSDNILFLDLGVGSMKYILCEKSLNCTFFICALFTCIVYFD